MSYQPAVYRFKLTTRSGQIVNESTATMTQAEAWEWAKEASARCREGACSNNYAVKVECVS